MIRRLVILIISSIAFWLAAVTIGQATGLLSDTALLHSAVAAGLCLIPTAATLLWTAWGLKQSPEQQMVAILGGTGVRLFFVLGVGLILWQWVEKFQQMGFWVWLLVFYVFTLALEMVLLVAGRSEASESQEAVK